jgi:cytochrome P450
MTIGLLRPVPKFLRHIVGPLLPSSRRLDRQLKRIQRELLGPMIEKRRKMEASGDSGYQKPDDFLQWMMDLARNDNEGNSDNLAHRLLGITSMAVVHTSAMSMTHAIFDLIEMPQWLEPLRAEIKSVIPDWNSTSQADLVQLRGLDSFLKESQRFNPPGERECLRTL